MYDNFDYQGFLAKNKLGPYAKTGKLNEAGFDPDQMQLDHELEEIYTMVEEVLGDDVSDQTFQKLVDKIQADWSKNGGRGQGDVYDFTRSYLMDWVSDARSEGGGRLTKDDNNSIWGSDWQGVISRATEFPEPGDDYWSDDKGSYDKNAGWQGRLEEKDLEENAQEDEDGDQVTHRFTEPRPIEVVSMGSNGAVIKVEKPNGEIEDVDFELDGDIEAVDPPYGYEGTIWGYIDGKEYGIAVSLVDMGGAGYDMEISSSEGLNFLEESGPSNQQEDEDGDQVFENEEAEATQEATPEQYKKFMNAFHAFIVLKDEGVITREELDGVSKGVIPIYDRLREAAGK